MFRRLRLSAWLEIEIVRLLKIVMIVKSPQEQICTFRQETYALIRGHFAFNLI